ncbi:MAG: ankyrin repeat domain-containing protein [Rickettsiaceae bacterium]|nr:ankyrin repeat domain-containing protein [Rickettsiaceae bacterium]
MLRRNNLIHNAIRDNNIEEARRLINLPDTDVNVVTNIHNINYNSDCPWNWSLLHSTAFFNRYKLLKLLIEKGADVNARTPTGDGAFHLAYRRWGFSPSI